MKRNIRISLIIMMLSISLFCCYHIYYYFINDSSDNLIRDYYVVSESNDNKEKLVTKINNKQEEYLGIISIPKISFKAGFYDKNSKNNNVNKSVMILKESIMPSDNGSIIYLAAHSGTGYLAYFKDLNKLTNEDIINISIKDKNYEYSIFDIYELPKTGNIIVNHNINEDYLVLTTCSNNKNMQLVITAKMINKV